MRLFDTHCHLNDPAFEEDQEEILQKMRENNVTRAACIGTDIATSRVCIDFAQKHDGIYAAAGVHPHDAKDAPEDYLDRIRAMLHEEKVVALGEIGLDYHYDLSPRDIQRRFLKEQTLLAVEEDVPAVYHIREAQGEMVDFFRSLPRLPRGIIHCYSGSAETAAEYLRMGFYISFAGPVTFKKAPNLWEAAKTVPEDRLLIETDSPYLAPEPVRGRRNDPSNVRYVLEKLAMLRNTDPETLAEITYRNACIVYGITPAR